jgi:RES domain-containing protein
MVSAQFADTAFDGEGAARYTGRWNDRGVRMVYTADSLALATLELSVHLVGAIVTYVAIEVDIPDDAVEPLTTRLAKDWQSDESATQRIGTRWAGSRSSAALLVPSALIDARSGERNVLINPAHQRSGAIVEVQRFEVVLDERLR